MQSSAVIGNNCCPIDFSNLCGGNDYAALTDGYNRKKITELVWSVQDDIDRTFVYKAIFVQKKLDNCPEDDDNQYEQLLGEQLGIQREYFEEKSKNTLKHPDLNSITQKTKGYNTTEIGVLMYFICDNMGIYMRNDDTKNCEQKVAIPPIAKAFGFSESSFTDKLNLDFADSATRKAMKKVATDFKDFMPNVAKEILRQYEEYEEDFSERQREKRKKSA